MGAFVSATMALVSATVAVSIIYYGKCPLCPLNLT
jgi:hypothetical protein